MAVHMNQIDREIEAFEQLKPRLEKLWDRIFPGDEEAYTSVVVPSLTLDQEEMAKIDGISFYEERLLFLLMRLRNPRARVVYVTSQPIHPMVLEYYLQLLVGVPASHARSRLTLLCAYDSTPRSLTEKILERPKLVERIRAAILDPREAYLTVFNGTALERRLAVLLGIPMNAMDPRLASLGTKSGSRRIFREAAVPMPFGFENLHSMDEIAGALVEIAAHRPNARRAVLKFNDSFSGEGNAIFEFPPIVTADAITVALGEVRFSISHETPEAYFAKFARVGGIAEEFIDIPGRTSPSVQLRINPRREVILASTHEQILGGPDEQVFLGCRFPAHDQYRLEIQDAALRVGRVLAEKGVIGRLSVDFIAWPEAYEWKFTAIETNLRMGGTTHPMLALRFLTGGSLDPASGLFFAPDGRAKYYRASDNVQANQYRGLLPEDLIEILVLNKIDFNQRSGTGVLFHLIGALSQFGKVGLTAIGDSPQEVEKLFEKTIGVLDRETANLAHRPAEGMESVSTIPVSRDDAIGRLRLELIHLTGPGKSACQVAAEKKIFCGGFGRYSDKQLRSRYESLVAADPSLSRASLEEKANEWQLQRQRDCSTLLSCDAQWQRYETCHGWDDFTNDELAHFCFELLGQRLEVSGAKTLPVI